VVQKAKKLLQKTLKKNKLNTGYGAYTVAGKVIGFAPEQPLHVVALAYSASGILK
jgi:hypothetical protein